MTPFGHVSRLYEDCPNNDTTTCLEFLQKHPPMHIRGNSDELMVFHTAWVGGMVPVHQFLLYSYLATQNLSRSILVYWIEESKYQNFTSDPLLEPLRDHPNIIFKCFNMSLTKVRTEIIVITSDIIFNFPIVTKLTPAGIRVWNPLKEGFSNFGLIIYQRINMLHYLLN